MNLTKEEQYYAQKGKRYKISDKQGKDYLIVITDVCLHTDGHVWLEHLPTLDTANKKVDSIRLNNLILGIHEGLITDINY